MDRKRPVPASTRDRLRNKSRMETQVAFLRAINVGGHAKVRMEDLGLVFSAAGCENVRTVIQSGNVLFDVPVKDRKTVQERIRSLLREVLDDGNLVIFRDLRNLSDLLLKDPFGKVRERADVKFYVGFYSQKPMLLPQIPRILSEEGMSMVMRTDAEVFVVSRRKKNGMFGFPNAFVEKEFGVAATTRNWSTIQKIVKRATM